MKTKTLTTLVSALTLGTAQLAAPAGEFHFSGGFTYVQGINNAWDELETLYQNAGYTVSDSLVIPVGLTLNPYYEFGSGFAVGLDVGPVAIIAIDQFGGGTSTSDISFILPLGVDLRYTFLRDKIFSPYLRAGVRYPIVGGPNLDSSQIGAFGAVGVELWRTKGVGMGIEVGYDTSKISVKGPTGSTASVSYPAFTASVLVRF